MKGRNIAFVGAGVMGEAFIMGLLRQNIVPPGNILAVERRADHSHALHQRLSIRTSATLQAAENADVLVVCVKPQQLDAALKNFRLRKADALVMSVVAGASLEVSGGVRSPFRAHGILRKRLASALHHTGGVVRVMPNTPAQIGQGVSAWVASSSTSTHDIETTKTLLSALGDEVNVEEEAYMDMVTALSGSGPAYAFLFLESLIDAGVHMGLPRRIAEMLTIKTVSGSCAFYEHAQRHPATLRNQVTSPGGTTSEALYQLEKGGFRTAISRAVFAAYRRAELLGRKKD